MVNGVTAFSPNYVTARQRFRNAATARGWSLDSQAVENVGPDDCELFWDAAYSPVTGTDKAIIISSGLHGVEGFFGSAVQLAFLESQRRLADTGIRYLFLHGLNPYGFAWLRRFTEDNVDLNRNFLLPGEPYAGAPEGYAALDGLLNPKCPPSRWEPFRLKALLAVAGQGMNSLRQTIAAGQYEFPQGLFFGGLAPSATSRWLAAHLPRWLEGVQDVLHLDIHTGLGRWGDSKLLIDYELTAFQRQRLSDWFGSDSFEIGAESEVAYPTRGSFGKWCVSQGWAANYLYACAEVGTYDPIHVLGALRAENQAHHWSTDASTVARWAKQRLKESFCPSSPGWRAQTVEDALQLLHRGERGLAALPSGTN